MPYFLDFEQLYFFLNFTQEQREICTRRLYYYVNLNKYYDALKIIYFAEIAKKYTPEIASVCIDLVINEHKEPLNIALIIDELVSMNIFSTLEETQFYLRQIKNYPKKEALHLALSWLNTLGLPNEILHLYFLPNITSPPKHGSCVFKQINACYRTILTADFETFDTLTSLVKLLKNTNTLLYTDHIKFIHKIVSHKNIHTLNEVFSLLCQSKHFAPFTNSSKHCLDVILHDQKTTMLTACILVSIMPDPSLSTDELTQSDCDKISCYAEKEYLVKLILTLKQRLKWSQNHIQACILAICDIQPPTADMVPCVRIFLKMMRGLNQIACELFYRKITPLLHPNTRYQFMNLTALLQNTDQRLLKAIDETVNSVEYSNARVSRRLNIVIPKYLPILRIYLEASTSLIHDLSAKMERRFPFQPSIKQTIYESKGHALYCHDVIRTSHLFFGHTKKSAQSMKQDDIESEQINFKTLT